MNRLRNCLAVLAGLVSSIFVLPTAPAQAWQTFIPTEEFFPGYIVFDLRDADIDGNGAVDHAVLLRDPFDDAPNGIFSIVMGHDGGRYELAYAQSIDHLTDDGSISVVDVGTPIRPVRSVDFGRTEARLKNPGIMHSFLQNLATFLYWNEALGRIEEFSISK